MKAPQFNRIAWGAVSALLAVIAVSVTQQLWLTYTSSVLPRRVQGEVFLGVGLGIFWLGDYVGVIRAPYTPSVLSMLTANSAAGDVASSEIAGKRASESEQCHSAKERLNGRGDR